MSAVTAPQAVLELAERLKMRHGDVRICREKSGWHLYIASPACLEQDGRVELTKKHLALNAEKHLALGRFANRRGNFDQDSVAQCMKTGRAYPVSELLRMPPLEKRGISTRGTSRVSVSDTSKSLVRDARGNLVPDVPGITVPLSQLPPGHPALWYLASRNYDIAALEAQFGACFCVQEAPESEALSRWYRKGPDGFRDTPQNRIVFYVDIHGVRKGWQARYLEYIDPSGVKYVMHPYRNQWVPVARKDETGKFTPLPGYETLDLSKYKTAFGARRNEILMGVDAALKWNADRQILRPVCVISEGPLDAGRVGPPGLAVLGKSLSENQANLISQNFRRVIVVGDNDKAGREAKVKMVAELRLAGLNDIKVVDVPEQYKDLGEMLPGAAAALLAPHLTQ